MIPSHFVLNVVRVIQFFTQLTWFAYLSKNMNGTLQSQVMTSSGTLQNIAYNSAHIEQLNVLALTFISNLIFWLGDLQNSGDTYASLCKTCGCLGPKNNNL